MYNGIGLQTPRGSGTNGYVQRNWAAVRKPKDRIQYKTEKELMQLDEANNKQPNREILDHESKRKIEIKCLELSIALEDEGYTPAEIAQKVDEYRNALTSNKTDVTEIPRDEYGRVAVRETHQIAEAQQEKNAKLREAFGISEYFVEGSSLDPQRKAKEALAKAAAEPVRYNLVKTPSPEKDVLKEEKLKSKSRDSASSSEKKKEKKKKSKKRKKKSDHDSASKPKKKKKSSSKKNKKKKHEESSDDSSDSSDDSASEKRRSSSKRTEKMKGDSKKRSDSRSPPPKKDTAKEKYISSRHRPRNRSDSFDDYRNRNSSRKGKDKSPLSSFYMKESVSPHHKRKSISPSYRRNKGSASPYQHSKPERKKSISPSSRKKKKSPSPTNRYKDRSISSSHRRERKSISPPSFRRQKRSMSPQSYKNKRSVSPKYDKNLKNSWKKRSRHSSRSSSESKVKSHRSSKRKMSPSSPKGKLNKNISRSRSKSLSPPPKKSKSSFYNFDGNREGESDDYKKTNGSKYRSQNENRSNSHKKIHSRNSFSSSRSKSPVANRDESGPPRKSRSKYQDSASKYRYDSKKGSSKSPGKSSKQKSRKSKNHSRSSSSSSLSYSPLNKNPERYREILKSKISQPQPVVRLRSFSSENEGGDSTRRKNTTVEDKILSALDFLQSELSAKVKESKEKKFSSNKNNVENSLKDKSSKTLPARNSNDLSSSTPLKTQIDLTKKSPAPNNSPSKVNFTLQTSNRKLPSPAVIDDAECNKKVNLPSKFVIDLDSSPKIKKIATDNVFVSSPISRIREESAGKRDVTGSPGPKSPFKLLKSDLKNQSLRSSPASLKVSSPGKKQSPFGSPSRESASPHLCRKSRKRDSNGSSVSTSNDEDSPNRGSSSSDSSDSSHDSDSSDRSSSRSISIKRRSSRSLSGDSKHNGSNSRSRSRSRSSRSRSGSSSASERAGSFHSAGRRVSRSSSRSVSPKRRSESRSVSRHSKRSASRTGSRSHSSSRSRSRSPSIPRRKGSPSFLDRRRITSPKSKKYSSDSSSSSNSSTSSSSSSSTSDSD